MIDRRINRKYRMYIKSSSCVEKIRVDSKQAITQEKVLSQKQTKGIPPTPWVNHFMGVSRDSGMFSLFFWSKVVWRERKRNKKERKRERKGKKAKKQEAAPSRARSLRSSWFCPTHYYGLLCPSSIILFFQMCLQQI